MSQTQRDVASFLIRFTQDLWRNSNGEPEVAWRGAIRHVQGEEQISFTDFAEAMQFIQGHLAQLTLDALPGGTKMDQEKALKDSFKLWEQFANSYSNMMFEAMERTIQQSEAIKDQMNKTVQESLKSWRGPAKSDEAGQFTAVLTEMSAQIEALAEKVGKLEKAITKMGEAK